MAEKVKLDLKKQLKPLYNPPAGEFTLVDVPPMNYLMIDGQGDPNTSQAYREALEALYAVAYTLKFASKRELGIDYGVMGLEGLWWAENMADFSMDDKDAWLWTSMILQPDHLTREMAQAAMQEAGRKKELPALPLMRFESLHEGLSVQIMHVGPYADEAPTLARLHGEWIPNNGYVENGKHHEIYLGDPRRTAPEKLRTVLRQPIRRRA